MDRIKYFDCINKTVQDYVNQCLEIANYITNHPEVSGEEKIACSCITEFLREYRYEITTPYVGVPYSFLAVKKNKTDKKLPKIALLCEYDALPEVGHACGHSVSGMISVLAALTLEKSFPDFPMQIDIIGTPGEELECGKVLIADNGGFEGYEFAAMAHLFSMNVPFFKVRAVGDMEVTFHGKSAHASAEPWEGRNALNAVQLFFHALDMMRQHITPDCQMHGVITNGGILPSIVPEEASCYFYPRADSMKNLNKLYNRMIKCAEGAAIATETTCEIKSLYPKTSDLYCTPTGKLMMQEIFDTLELPYSKEEVSLGSTDAGNVDLLIPTFHPGISIGDNANIKLHSKEFADLVKSDAAKATLVNGARVVAELCAELAYSEGLLDVIKEEHKAYRG